MPRSRLTLGKQLGKGQPAHANIITDAAHAIGLGALRVKNLIRDVLPVRELPNYYLNNVAANVISH